MDLLLQHSFVCSAQCEEGSETGGWRQGGKGLKGKGSLGWSVCRAVGQHVSHANQETRVAIFLSQVMEKWTKLPVPSPVY